MKNDDLERLEESREIQRLVRFTKEQYDWEKSRREPAPFSSLMGTIRERRGSRQGVSPWWIAAACLLGCVIGYGLSGMRSEALPERMAVADTVVLVRERVDTVYREVQPKSLVAYRSVAKPVSQPVSQIKPASSKQEVKRGRKTELDLMSPAYLGQSQSLPDPDSEYYAANGMTVAENDYPIHLLVSIPCK